MNDDINNIIDREGIDISFEERRGEKQAINAAKEEYENSEYLQEEYESVDKYLESIFLKDELEKNKNKKPYKIQYKGKFLLKDGIYYYKYRKEGEKEDKLIKFILPCIVKDISFQYKGPNISTSILYNNDYTNQYPHSQMGLFFGHLHLLGKLYKIPKGVFSAFSSSFESYRIFDGVPQDEYDKVIAKKGSYKSGGVVYEPKELYYIMNGSTNVPKITNKNYRKNYDVNKNVEYILEYLFKMVRKNEKYLPYYDKFIKTKRGLKDSDNVVAKTINGNLIK